MTAAIKAVIQKILGFCTKILTATGPLAVVRDVLSLTTIALGLIKFVKKLIKKIKEHKKSKQPETVTEYALANEEVRESAPEVKEMYESSIKKTANKLIGKPKKQIKDSKKLKDMLDALDEIDAVGNRKPKTKSRREMGVSELLDSDPVLRAWAFDKPSPIKRKVCHS